MQNLREAQEPINVDTRRGAFLHTTHTERNVKVYAVIETELRHISLLNTLATILFSIGSFFLAVAVSIIVDWTLQVESAELGKTTLLFLIVFGVLALLCYGFGIGTMLKRKAEWQQIGLNSKTITKDMPLD